MARKSHDLFEVLGARLGRPAGRAKPAAKAAKPRVSVKDREVATPLEIGRGIGTWFQTVIGGSENKSKAGAKTRRKPASAPRASRKKAGSVPPMAFGGTFLAVAVLISLSAGFLAGQLTGGDAAAEGNGILNGQAPGPLNTTKRAATLRLTPAQETQRLHDWVYQLAAYKESEREQASKLVHWLLGQGLETARMYQQLHSQNQQMFWVVACYSPAPDDREIYEQIKQLDPSAEYQSKLARRLSNLEAKPHRR